MAAVPLTIKDPKISVMGPRVFPYFIGICMILLSLALLAVTLVKHYKENVGETAAKECSPEVRRAALRDELRAVALAAIILLYSAFFATLGYFVSTLAVSTAILLLFRVRKIWAYPVVFGQPLPSCCLSGYPEGGMSDDTSCNYQFVDF